MFNDENIQDKCNITIIEYYCELLTTQRYHYAITIKLTTQIIQCSITELHQCYNYDHLCSENCFVNVAKEIIHNDNENLYLLFITKNELFNFDDILICDF